jgi:hypothetical protein
MKSYLEYVRGSPKYSSTFIESPLEWRPDVPDGMEVSTFHSSVTRDIERDLDTSPVALSGRQLIDEEFWRSWGAVYEIKLNYSVSIIVLRS